MCQVANASRMASREWRLQVCKVRKCQRDIIQLFLRQVLAWRRWLQRQHSRPQRLLLEHSPERRALCYRLECVNNRWVERCSSLALREVEGRFRAAELVQRFEEARREHDARGEGNCLATAAARSAPVPLLEHREQRGLDGLRHSESLSEPLGDLASRGDLVAEDDSRQLTGPRRATRIHE